MDKAFFLFKSDESHLKEEKSNTVKFFMQHEHPVRFQTLIILKWVTFLFLDFKVSVCPILGVI